MNGNYIIIKRGGKMIAGTKSDVIQSEAGTIEKSSPTSGSWKEFVDDRKEWSFSTNYLMLSASGVSETNTESFGLNDLLCIGTAYTIVISDRDNNTSLTGTAICTQCQVTARKGALVSGTFQFKGSGALA